MMNRKLLREAGLILYGNDHWRHQLAKQLRISPSTVTRWAGGKIKTMPPALDDKLAELLWQRMLRIDRVRDAIMEKQDDDSATFMDENA